MESLSCRVNQRLVEDAFIPTLQVLFDAPNTSPLSDVDENNVVDLLIQLTNHSLLKVAFYEFSTATSVILVVDRFENKVSP